MKDAELSLAVAKIMWPEYEWCADDNEAMYMVRGFITKFNHTTDDALGKMCLFVAQKFASPESTPDTFVGVLNCDTPHRAIAEAIVEAANG